ncbi:MAG: MBL fold metallo-hydrolase, partial [Bacteroidales bacterium]
NILFDVGGDFDILSENALKLGVDLTSIDIVIISHGHGDHGGALGEFLSFNSKATVYVQRRAFLPHYSLRDSGMADISLDSELTNHPNIILLDGDYQIDQELSLFTITDNSKCYSTANNSLYECDELDNFRHEQNLLINENGNNTLIIGCGHNGVVNILDRAEEYMPQLCVGGFHLNARSAGGTVAETLLNDIANELHRYTATTLYTCHCTGSEAYDYLKREIPNLNYLHCGDTINN